MDVLLEQNCVQQQPFEPTKNLYLNRRYLEYLTSNNYISGALERFSGAIQIPTVSYDSMRGEDIPVDIQLHIPFKKFHDYLEKSYPLVHSQLKRFVVNDYSLLFEWQGSNQLLKPAMLMAHQDVVPIDPSTISEWKFPPFSGMIDNDKIYGRGSTDTKMTLIGILEAVEALLQMGYEPNRTIYISFGHDEEISGYNGIKKIVSFMQNKLHIPNEGIEFILDEGMTMVDIISPNAFEDGMTSTTMALVGIAEKGYMDVNITVSMNQGGHASIAPDHTGIGILSKIITVIEDHPSTPDLLNTNPIIKNLQCISSHTNLFSIHERYMIDHWEYFKVFVIRLLERSKGWKAAITTSQAVDVIHGGVKVNALPQFSYALMNMRIAPHETDQIVAERISKLIAPISHKHNLDFYYNVHSHEPSNSTIGKVIVSFNDALAPSPISPTNEFPFERLSQVIKRVFGDVVVTPALMTANTDTKVSL